MERTEFTAPEQWLIENVPLFYDWLSNGRTAMPKIYCTNEDIAVLTVLGLVLAVIVVFYLIFAGQMFSAWRKATNRTGIYLAILCLSLVFLFCGLTGYLSMIIDIWIPMYRIQTILAIPLAISALILVICGAITGMARKIFALDLIEQKTGS